MKQSPADFRERLVCAIAAGLARAAAARLFGVTERTIRRWQHRRQETGTCAPPLPPPLRPGRPPRSGDVAAAARRTQVATTPDATVAQPCAAGTAGPAQPISQATMWRTLARLGLTVTKNR